MRYLAAEHLLTHAYNNAEQAADNPVYYLFKLLIGGARAVQCPVCVLLLHAQREQVVAFANKVQVLVVDLGDVF